MILHTDIPLSYFWNTTNTSSPVLGAGNLFYFDGSQVVHNDTGFPDSDFLNFLNGVFRRLFNGQFLTKNNIDIDILQYLFNNDISSQNLFCSLKYCPTSMQNIYYVDKMPSDTEHETLIIGEKNVIVNFTDVNIYENILDNSNVFQTLNGLLQVPSPQLSDDDYKLFMAVEAYNKNYLLYHENDGIVNSSENENIDLSTINTQLTNIANNLKVVEKDDQQQDIDVSIAEIEKNKQLYVVNNIDISDKLSFKPKSNGYPDDDLVI